MCRRTPTHLIPSRAYRLQRQVRRESRLRQAPQGLWMGDKMDHSLINPNQLRLYGVTVQNNPAHDSPLYIMTEDGDFVLPLGMKGTNIMATTCTPTLKELHDCMHITLSSHHPWNPHRVRFPESSRTVQEEMYKEQR